MTQPPQQQGQPVYPGRPVPMRQQGAQAGSRPAGPNECRLCGSAPAAQGTFRGHQGFLVLMRFLSLSGPFCRDCGLATFRRMTSGTLWQGWWGVASMIITPFVLLRNVVLRERFTALASPYRDPAVVAPLPAPMDPGPPVFARPLSYVFVVPLVAILSLVAVSIIGELVS